MNACPLCSGPMRDRLQTKDLSRPDDQTVWQVGWCDACDFGRIMNPVTPEQVASFYMKDYYTHGTPKQTRAMSLSDRIVRRLAWQFDQSNEFDPREVRGRTACDIGCGDGLNLQKLKAAGFDAVGVEPDAAAREVAMCHGTVFAGTAEHLPADLGCYDAILMSHSFEHMNDPVTALKNCAGILAPGGTIVIEVPNNASIWFDVLGAPWAWSDIPRHLNFFTETSLRAVARTCGLSVSRVIYTGYARQFHWRWIEQVRAAGGKFPIPSLLFRTLHAAPPLKYDSVRVHLVQQPPEL